MAEVTSRSFRATALERAVGRKLAGWRNELDLTLTEAGGRVGFSSAKLSLMENAMQPCAPVDIMALGYVYKVPTPEWQFVMSQSRHAAELRTVVRPEPEIFDRRRTSPSSSRTRRCCGPSPRTRCRACSSLTATRWR